MSDADEKPLDLEQAEKVADALVAEVRRKRDALKEACMEAQFADAATELVRKQRTEAEACVARLVAALEGLLADSRIKETLEYGRRGIGTNTDQGIAASNAVSALASVPEHLKGKAQKPCSAPTPTETTPEPPRAS